jgi:hypothetical protein
MIFISSLKETEEIEKQAAEIYPNRIEHFDYSKMIELRLIFFRYTNSFSYNKDWWVLAKPCIL